MREALRWLSIGGIALSLAGETHAEEAIVWSRYASEDTVTVTTRNRDGSDRNTTVWLVVVRGQGYLRTGSTRWGGNVERDPNVRLRAGTDVLPLRAQFVTDSTVRAEVTQAFRDKYGWSDRIVGVFRGRSPKILRLLLRHPE